MPNDAATLVALCGLFLALSVLESLNGFVHRTELSVPRDDFARPTFDMLEGSGVANNVKKVLRAQHASNKDFLAAQARTVPRSHRFRPIIALSEEKRLTCVPCFL